MQLVKVWNSAATFVAILPSINYLRWISGAPNVKSEWWSLLWYKNFGECVQELHDLSFTKGLPGGENCFVFIFSMSLVEIKLFVSSFIMRNVKVWN